jgi:hypothetical protein
VLPDVRHHLPMPRTGSKAILALCLVCLAACGPSRSPTAEPAPSSGGGNAVCPVIELRTARGERLDLAGQWRGSDFGEYFVSQSESCVDWLGLNDPEVGADEPWSEVFVGHLNADFTVDGEIGSVPYQTQGELGSNHELTLKVDFFDAGGQSWPTMNVIATSAGGEYLSGLDWVLESSLPPRTQYTGTYGFDEPDCPWLEVDGDRYEIVQWQYDITLTGQILGFESNQISAHPGDQLRVEAQISPPMGPTDCEPSAMLVWDLQP